MPLFDVPGWSVSAEPVADQPGSARKRKRSPSGSTLRVASSEINFDKLVSKLKRKPHDEHTESPARRQRKNDRQLKQDANPAKRGISRPMPLLPKGKMPPPSISVESTESLVPPKKKVKTAHDDQAETSSMTKMQREMKQSLDGARFRLINESLYKSDSQSAHQMMQDDPDVFTDYHVGFRHQVQSWPTNPVEHYIKVLSSYPSKTVIADLGCGDAALARALTPKDKTVLSYDLVSTDPFVIEADTCNHIPLPGSEGSRDEKSEGEAGIVDVVVCALSLMGTNWPKCIRESWRILRPGGELKIAEVSSRFTNIKDFLSVLSATGFHLKSKDETNTHFTLFELKKIPRKWKEEKEWDKLLAKGEVLKPCEYKRR